MFPSGQPGYRPMCLTAFSANVERDRETNRQTDKERERERDTQTDRQTEKDRERDREVETERQRHRDRESLREKDEIRRTWLRVSFLPGVIDTKLSQCLSLKMV